MTLSGRGRRGPHRGDHRQRERQLLGSTAVERLHRPGVVLGLPAVCQVAGRPLLGAIAESEHAQCPSAPETACWQPGPGAALAGSARRSPHARPRSSGRCTTPATTPSSRSPPSSALPAPPSTATLTRPARNRRDSSAGHFALVAASLSAPVVPRRDWHPGQPARDSPRRPGGRAFMSRRPPRTSARRATWFSSLGRVRRSSVTRCPGIRSHRCRRP